MKEISGSKGYYITETGEVWSHKRKEPKQLSVRPDKDGYLIVSMGKVTKYVHRLVAEHYLDDWDADLQVDHIDRDRTNNNVSNLRMVTQQQNQWNTDAKGYYYNKQAQKWKAHIFVDGCKHHLGYYCEEHEAKAAYLRAKAHYHRYKV